jgi:DNA-binding SARP family transcriptional activator
MTTLTERLAVRRVTFLRHEGDQTHLYAEMDENQAAPTFLSNALSDEAIGRIAPMSVIRLAVQQKTTICIDSTEAVALSVRDPYFAGLSSMVLLCAPLMAHGHIIALLLLERQQAPLDHQEVLFSPSEITYIEVVGAHAALLVENSLLRERLVVSASGGGDAAISAWLLGSLRVIYGSRDITPYFQGRLRDLISLLLLQPMDAPITRAEIAAKFWPDTTEGQALTNVRNLLHKLRTALPEAGTLLKITRQQIQWNSTADRWVDVHAFERGVAEASRLSGAAAIHLLRSSVELYRGDLLTGTNDEWVLPIQERLHERLLASLARLVDLLIEDHDYVGAQHYAQLLVSVAPLREEPYRQLIRTYAIAGDTVAARQVYETCVAMLAREFDAPPSPATETIYRHFVGD